MSKHDPTGARLKKVPERTPLFAWGAGVTVLYLVALGLLSLNFEKSIFDLAPNELGDFLAGSFSPLAFLWLVLGFLQQGQELRIQAVELNNSVEQSRQLVEVTRQQLALDREALADSALRVRLEHSPQFRIMPAGSSSGSGSVTFRNTITNVGGDAIDFKCVVHWDDAEPSVILEVPRAEKGSSFNANFGTQLGKERSGKLILSYKNVIGHHDAVVSVFQYDSRNFTIHKEPT